MNDRHVFEDVGASVDFLSPFSLFSLLPFLPSPFSPFSLSCHNDEAIDRLIGGR